MEPDLSFRLMPAPVESDPRSQLVEADGTLIAEVRGRVLEAVFRLAKGILVLSSDGNPYEEELHVYLFSTDKCAIDNVSLGQTYSSGIVKDLRVSGENCLEFSFFGSETWRLTVLAQSEIRFKPDLFSSVKYPDGWLREHFLRLERIRD